MTFTTSKTPRVLYGITIIVMVVAVALLWQLLKRFERDIETNIRGLQRVLSNESMLRTPYDPSVRFSQIEDLVSKYSHHPYLREMTITKYFGKKEDVVYPFFYRALRAAVTHSTSSLHIGEILQRYPDPERLESDVIKIPLVGRSQLLGHAYVRLDRTALRNVQLAITVLTLILLAFIVTYLIQFRRQEEVISQTTIELEEKKRELVRLERLALAGQLSANLLHDLKKPVLNIKNELSDLIADNPNLPLPLKEKLELLLDQTRIFFSLLHETNLEKFARGEGEEEFVDINETLHKSLALVRYERGQVEEILQLSDSLPPVYAKQVQLIQVFSNIILNAFQAMRGKGKLIVRSMCIGNKVVVEIEDSGGGIPPELADKIFTPFYTTKPSEEGSGLGLYISRDIVHQLRGKLSVRSVPGGTVFSIELPIRSETDAS